jgi:predicted transcriptional regulator
MDGAIYFEIVLTTGGGQYGLEIYSNRPPVANASLSSEVLIYDEAPVRLFEWTDFEDPEGDDLWFDYYEIVNLDGTDLRSNLELKKEDDGLYLDPTKRGEGRGMLTVVAWDFYDLKTEFTFIITLERSGLFGVEVLWPYNITNTVPDPVVLTYFEHEMDDSIILNKIFEDPLDHLLEYNVKFNIEDGVDIKVVPPWDWGDKRLSIILDETLREEGREFETIVKLSAYPTDLPEYVSDTVLLTVKVTRGEGHAPAWVFSERVEMSEDGTLELDLDDFIEDEDTYDQNMWEYDVIVPTSNLFVTKKRRDKFLFESRKDWCGVVEDVEFIVTDTFGWRVLELVNINVLCEVDGPVLLFSNPSPEEDIEIFEGEEVAFAIFVSDVDEGVLFHDWYINDHPHKLDGEQTFSYTWGLNSAGTYNVKTEVWNSNTLMSVQVEWKVIVEHINLAPTARIEIVGEPPGTTDIELDTEESVSLKGIGTDPEKSNLTYKWDFGDGWTENGVSATHNYRNPGNYIVTLIVSDGEFSTFAHVNVTVKKRAGGNVVATPPTLPWIPALWIATILIVMSAVGMGSTEPGKYKIFMLLTLLYTKIKKTEVLDHYLRGRIQGYITANPGAHYNMIKADLRINNGNLAYHLMVLEKQGYIKALRDGIYKRFYPETMKVTKPPSLQERILVLLRGHPGLTQKEIARKLDKRQSTVNDYIRRMVGAQLIRIERAGVRNHCFVMEEPIFTKEQGRAKD